MTDLERTLLAHAYRSYRDFKQNPDDDSGCLVIHYGGDDISDLMTRKAVERLTKNHHLVELPRNRVQKKWRPEPEARARYFRVTSLGTIAGSKIAEDQENGVF